MYLSGGISIHVVNSRIGGEVNFLIKDTPRDWSDFLSPGGIGFFFTATPPFLAKTEGGENGVASFFSKQSGVAKKGVAKTFLL